MATTTSLADAKNRLSEIVQLVVTTHERVTITRNRKPAVVIVAVDDLEALEDTLAILSDDWLMAGIRDGEAALDVDDFVTEATIRADLATRKSTKPMEK
jgi:antitoxin YefM